MIEADRVVLLQGEPEVVNTPSNSGKGQKIVRCSDCRIALWSNYAGAGDAVRFVRVGTLDDPDRLPPDIHIFTSSNATMGGVATRHTRSGRVLRSERLLAQRESRAPPCAPGSILTARGGTAHGLPRSGRRNGVNQEEMRP